MDSRAEAPQAEPVPWSDSDWLVAFDERAGFLEYDCGLPRAEAERLAWGELPPEGRRALVRLDKAPQAQEEDSK